MLTTPSSDVALESMVKYEEGHEQEQPVVVLKGSTQSMDFPEGGLTAWLTIAGGTIVLFVTFGAVQSFGVYEDYYARVSLAEHTPSQISWIGSFQLFMLFAMGIVSGKLFDEGYFHHLMAAGSLIYLFSFFMLSLTQPHQFYQIFLSQGVGMGLGMGLLFSPALSIASHYFRRRRAFAMGFVFAGSSIGGIIYPTMLNHLFFGKVGFAWGVRITAFILLALLSIANVIMKTRLPPRRVRPETEKPNMVAIIMDLPYCICIGGIFLILCGLFFPFFYLQLFAITHGVNQNDAFYSITILNAAALFGRPLPNFLADVYGPFNVMIPMVFVSGILIFAMFGAGSLSGMIVFAILYGFFSGGCISLVFPMISTFSKSISDIGTRVGISMFIVSFAVLAGTPIAGALVDAPHYTWSRPIIFSGVSVLLGAILITISRSYAVKRKGTWRV